jgi:hypothetical protein
MLAVAGARVTLLYIARSETSCQWSEAGVIMTSLRDPKSLLQDLEFNEDIDSQQEINNINNRIRSLLRTATSQVIHPS